MIINANLPQEDYEICTRLFLKHITERGCSADIAQKIALDFSSKFSEGQFQIAELPDKSCVQLTAADRFGMICAIGKLLRTGRYTSGRFASGEWRGISTPEKPYRIAYLASHFSNILHVAPFEFME